MKVISWNVRGLNASDKIHKIRFRLNRIKPHVVCLQETKLSSPFAMNAFHPFFFAYNVIESFDPLSSKGGVVTLLPKSWHILEEKVLVPAHVVRVIVACEDGVFGITNIYAPSNNTLQRVAIWDMIKEDIKLEKWMLLGDFNMVCRREDKFPPCENAPLTRGEEEAWEELCVMHGLCEPVSTNSFT